MYLNKGHLILILNQINNANFKNELDRKTADEVKHRIESELFREYGYFHKE